MANFTVRTGTRNNGGVSKQHTTNQGHWFVVFTQNGALQHIIVPWQSSRSVREILADDYNIDIADAEVEFLRG